MWADFQCQAHAKPMQRVCCVLHGQIISHTVKGIGAYILVGLWYYEAEPIHVFKLMMVFMFNNSYLFTNCIV